MTTAIVFCCRWVKVDRAGAGAAQNDTTAIVFTSILVVIHGGCVRAAWNIALAIACALRKSIATANPTLIDDVAFAVTRTFRDAGSTAHATLVEHQTTAVVERR